MITTQLVDKVAADNNISKNFAKSLVRSVFDNINQGLADNGKVSIHDFGVFSVVKTKPRQLNDAMGGGIAPARNRPKFKPSKHLKDSLN